ncbi:MAG: hypothetical protein R2690_04280 [Acidimicrobiales bacterium]
MAAAAHPGAPLGQRLRQGSVELWGEDRQLLAFGTSAHVRPVDISRFAPGGGTA